MSKEAKKTAKKSEGKAVDKKTAEPKKVEKAVKKEKHLMAIVTRNFSCSRGGRRTYFQKFRAGDQILDQELIRELVAGNAPLDLIEV